MTDTTLVQRLRRGAVAYTTPSTPVYEGPTTLEREAADEIDRLTAELAEARITLADLVSWFSDKPSEPEWRIKAGKYGADDAISAARSFLTSKGE